MADLGLISNEELIDELVRRQELTGSSYWFYVEDDEAPGDGFFWSDLVPEEARLICAQYELTLLNGEECNDDFSSYDEGDD